MTKTPDSTTPGLLREVRVDISLNESGEWITGVVVYVHDDGAFDVTCTDVDDPDEFDVIGTTSTVFPNERWTLA